MVSTHGSVGWKSMPFTLAVREVNCFCSVVLVLSWKAVDRIDHSPSRPTTLRVCMCGVLGGLSKAVRAGLACACSCCRALCVLVLCSKKMRGRRAVFHRLSVVLCVVCERAPSAKSSLFWPLSASSPNSWNSRIRELTVFAKIVFANALWILRTSPVFKS